MKKILRSCLPAPIWDWLGKVRLAFYQLSLVQWLHRGMLRFLLPGLHFDASTAALFNSHGFNVSLTGDFYSPLPLVTALEQTFPRWSKPSALVGLHYSLPRMQATLAYFMRSEYLEEYRKKFVYATISKQGYGPGYPALDAMLLYCMMREKKPRQYLEIGSGVSTYYCASAAEENQRQGAPLSITCIDPYPHQSLKTIQNVHIIAKEVQDVELATFEMLQSGDVLFIDSTHIVKLDGDVPYLYLEVLPRLPKGVLIHIHDIHFPYNIPYPPQYYVFGKKRPIFWTEAMLLQAFLCFNESYDILMSAPLLRYFDEPFLCQHVPEYTPLSVDRAATHFGSIWLEKVK